MSWQGKTVLVLGLGESGLAIVRWLAREGAMLRVADSRQYPPSLDALARIAPDAEVVLGPFQLALLDDVDAVAISPGLDPRNTVVEVARERRIPVTGEIQIFVDALEALGQRAATRLIAITGTNGKTTTTTLAAALCAATGLDAVAAGNISPATLNVLLDRLEQGQRLPDCWVLELSSFQLETVSRLHADVAAVLNVTDDHLDRYDSIDDYVAAKARALADARVRVLNRDDARVRMLCQAEVSFGLGAPAREGDYGWANGFLMRGHSPLIAGSELALKGLHNVANALAALALCEAVGCPLPALVAALRDFRGLPHRVEPIAQRDDGVTYFDDSKGTNVGATVAALEGLGRKVVLIAGGDGKGQDFSPLAPAVRAHARAVILIGRDAGRIQAVLADAGVPVEYAEDLPRAVLRADALACDGDAVLLSPACASFDMFRSYVHRAEVFVEAVRALPRVEAL
jgi:UDP-N-acetylmuramoylalanine--D-glutamate ligase